MDNKKYTVWLQKADGRTFIKDILTITEIAKTYDVSVEIITNALETKAPFMTTEKGKYYVD